MKNPLKNPFDFFDVIYCISLMGSIDRREKISEEFRKVGIYDRVNFILGMPSDTPAYDCDKTHAYCLREALENNCENALIFEDDAYWIRDDTLEVLAKSIQDLPDDWDLFYLGGSVFTPAKKVTGHLARMNMVSSLVSYSVNRHFFEKVSNSITPDDPLDNVIARKIMPFSNSYLAVPPLTCQRPSWSNVQKRDVDYTDMMLGMYKDNIK